MELIKSSNNNNLNNAISTARKPFYIFIDFEGTGNNSGLSSGEFFIKTIINNIGTSNFTLNDHRNQENRNSFDKNIGYQEYLSNDENKIPIMVLFLPGCNSKECDYGKQGVGDNTIGFAFGVGIKQIAKLAVHLVKNKIENLDHSYFFRVISTSYSRGGIAAIRFAEAFGDYAPYRLEINLFCIDPVPGDINLPENSGPIVNTVTIDSRLSTTGQKLRNSKNLAVLVILYAGLSGNGLLETCFATALLPSIPPQAFLFTEVIPGNHGQFFSTEYSGQDTCLMFALFLKQLSLATEPLFKLSCEQFYGIGIATSSKYKGKQLLTKSLFNNANNDLIEIQFKPSTFTPVNKSAFARLNWRNSPLEAKDADFAFFDDGEFEFNVTNLPKQEKMAVFDSKIFLLELQNLLMLLMTQANGIRESALLCLYASSLKQDAIDKNQAVSMLELLMHCASLSKTTQVLCATLNSKANQKDYRYPQIFKLLLGYTSLRDIAEKDLGYFDCRKTELFLNENVTPEQVKALLIIVKFSQKESVGNGSTPKKIVTKIVKAALPLLDFNAKAELLQLLKSEDFDFLRELRGIIVIKKETTTWTNISSQLNTSWVKLISGKIERLKDKYNAASEAKIILDVVIDWLTLQEKQELLNKLGEVDYDFLRKSSQEWKKMAELLSSTKKSDQQNENQDNLKIMINMLEKEKDTSNQDDKLKMKSNFNESLNILLTPISTTQSYDQLCSTDQNNILYKKINALVLTKNNNQNNEQNTGKSLLALVMEKLNNLNFNHDNDQQKAQQIFTVVEEWLSINEKIKLFEKYGKGFLLDSINQSNQISNNLVN